MVDFPCMRTMASQQKIALTLYHFLCLYLGCPHGFFLVYDLLRHPKVLAGSHNYSHIREGRISALFNHTVYPTKMSPEQQLPLAARKDSALGAEISEISPEWQYSVLTKDAIDKLGPEGLPGQIGDLAKKGVELEVVGDADQGSDVCVRIRTLQFLDVSKSASRPKKSEVEKTSLTTTQRYAALEVEDLPESGSEATKLSPSQKRNARRRAAKKAGKKPASLFNGAISSSPAPAAPLEQTLAEPAYLERRGCDLQFLAAFIFGVWALGLAFLAAKR